MNYAFLALVDISFHTLQPVFLATPIELGGLGLDPPMIGTVLSSFGILNALAFVFFFSPLTDYFGAKKVYMAGMFATVPCFALFPVITYLARKSVEQGGGLGTGVWVAVGIQVVLSVIFFLGYGTSVSEWLELPMHIPDVCRVACTFQAQCSFLSLEQHRTRLLWEQRMGSHNYWCPSCARSAQPWSPRRIRCRSTRSIII